jgi:hypothetical protein
MKMTSPRMGDARAQCASTRSQLGARPRWLQRCCGLDGNEGYSLAETRKAARAHRPRPPQAAPRQQARGGEAGLVLLYGPPGVPVWSTTVNSQGRPKNSHG